MIEMVSYLLIIAKSKLNGKGVYNHHKIGVHV